MSRVLIDTSTIINFEKLSHSIQSFSNPNAIIKRHPLDVLLIDLIENVVEAFLFYDEILLDERSISQSLRYNDWKDLFERPYCKFISTTEQKEERIYTEIISKFEVSPSNLSYLVNSIPSDWAPFYDAHNNLSIKGFIRNEAVIGSRYSAYLYSCIEYIQSKQLEEHLTNVPNQIIYEIIRYLYYIHLQKQENAQLIIHPCRDAIPVIMDIDENPFKNFLSNTNKIWSDRIRERCDYMSGVLPIPFIASYILSKTKSVENLFDVIEDVRNSKEAVNFRRALNDIINYVALHDERLLNKIQHEFKKTLLNWEDNLNIVPGYRFKSLNILRPLVSFEVDIPYIGGNKVANNIMTFIHKTILKADDYKIYKHLFQDCYGYRRPNLK